MAGRTKTSVPGKEEVTPIAKRKVLKMADARRMTREYLEQKDAKKQDSNAATQHPASRQRHGQDDTGLPNQERDKKRDIHPREKREASKARTTDRAYTADIDVNFFAICCFKKSKEERRWTGIRCGVNLVWRNGLERETVQLAKICFLGSGSSRKFGSESLLYLGSRDGFFNSAFHKRVDLQGPTLTLVMTSEGRIFGGYASVPWVAGTTGKLVSDPIAFLVSLSDGQGRPPIKIQQSDSSPDDAVFHDADLGPCFNRALGLQLDILAYSSSDFCKNAKYRIPAGYDDRTFLAGAYNGWDVQEVAVWAV